MTTSRWLITALSVIALGACTNEKIVFVTREPFNPPADSVNGFLGYYTIDNKQTTCGNCHIDIQNAWKTTKHASAWADLVGSGHQQAFCNNCHTVSQLGNAVPDSVPAGYAKVADSTYFDVQCESCHGPGYTHVQGPNSSNIPLARVNVDPDTNVAFTSPTCAACHQGTHNPFINEWAQSGHAGTVTEVITEYVADPVGEASCMACHEGRLTLKAWGVNTNYIERDSAITLNTALPVVCSVCHDPHNGQNAGQLRFAVDDPDPGSNLCMKCHNRRAEPSASSARGPHAPQGAVLLGYGGWWPSVRDTIVATHGNPSVNARLCAACHVNGVQGVDSLGVATFSTGHLFLPDPCLVNGKPVSTDCARPGDPGYTAGSRLFTGCAVSGCHNSATQAENAVAAQRLVIQTLSDALWADNDGDQVLYDTIPGGDFGSFDAGDAGLLTQLTPAQADTAFNFRRTPRVISVAEGVFFNVRLIGEDRYANGDRSRGAHNPLLSQTLLATSINEVQARYGLPVPPAVRALVDQTLHNVRQARIKAATRLSSR